LSQKSKIGNSAAALTVSKLITLSLSVVTAMLLSRSVSLDVYGTYSELQTIVSLAVSILALGLPNSLNYFLPTCTQEEKKTFLGFYYTAISIMSVIMGILLILFRGAIAKYYGNPQIVFYSLFLFLIPWSKTAISSRSNMLVVENKIKKEFLYCVANAVCLLLIALLLFSGVGNFKIYMNMYVAVETVFTALVYFEAYLSADKRIKPNLNINILKKVLVFSIPLGISTAISTISLDLDKLIIGFLLDEQSVAIYANAGKELPISYITVSFTAVVLPKVVKNIKENKTANALDIWKKSSEICFIIMSFFSVACIVFAPQIITFLYSEKYLEGVSIFRIYSLVLLFRITYWGTILNAFGKTKTILYNSIACLVLNLILSIGLYRVFGFIGPAIATCISIGAMCIFQLFMSARLVKEKILKIFPWKNFSQELLVNVILGTAVLGLTKIMNLGTDVKGIVFAIIIGIVWLVLYFLIFSKRILRIWKELNQC